MRLFTFLMLSLCLLGCSSDDNANNNNPFLLNTNFSVQLSTINALDLEFPGDAIYVPNGGIRGFFVINTGSGILAWEATDPNHSPNECSTMVEVGGINAQCQCEDAHTYSLFTGQSTGEVLDFAMRPYRVDTSGGTITVSN